MQAIIQTPTNDLQQSLHFYETLGFQTISEEYLTDGKAIIHINTNRFARAGIRLYQADWFSEVKALKAFTKVLPIENGYVFSDASGVWIYLMEEEIKFDISTYSASIIGNYAGVSLEVIDIERSKQIYNILGFEKSMGSLEQGWIVLSHSSGFAVSLMKPMSCPHLFFNPSLTFFNGKNNLSIIQEIRKRNIPIAEEITAFNKKGIVDNVILRDPGGYGFFIFSD